MRLKIGLILLTTFGLVANVQATPSINKSEAKSMSATDHVNPILTAPQALTMALKFIDKAQSNADLTPERVLQVTGIRLTATPYNDDKKLSFSLWQPLTKLWAWDMEINSDPDLSFVFSFNYNTGAEQLYRKPSATDVCQMDFDQVHQQLLAMRFKHVSDYWTNLKARQYRRGDTYLNIYYFGESVEKPKHHCVARMFLAFANQLKK